MESSTPILRTQTWSSFEWSAECRAQSVPGGGSPYDGNLVGNESCREAFQGDRSVIQERRALRVPRAMTRRRPRAAFEGAPRAD